MMQSAARRLFALLLGFAVSSGAILASPKQLTLNSLLTKTKSSKKNRAVTYTLSGASDDSVNYIRLCKATNDTCATCSEPVLEITGGTPASYTTSGTTYSISENSIKAYLAQSGLDAATYYIKLYFRSTHRKCNGNTEVCGTDADDAGSPHKLCLTAVYNGTNVTSLSRTDNGNAYLGTAASQHAYVSSQTGVINRCPVEADGSLGLCADAVSDTAPAWKPYSTTFNHNGAAVKAYVADPENVKVHYCSAASDGMLSGCTETTGSSWSSVSGNLPFAIAFHTVGGVKRAYVATGIGVAMCEVNTSTGDFTSCVNAAESPPTWARPRGISFSTLNGTTYAYVSDRFKDTIPPVFRCTINANNGKFSNCTAAFSNADRALQVEMIKIGTTRYAYLASYGGVRLCTLDGSSDFATCTATPPASVPDWRPYATATAPVDGTLRSYVASSKNGGRIFHCSVNGSGVFSSCSETANQGAPKDVSVCTF